MLTLYNEQRGRYEPFEPLNDGVATIYVCGITPYDTTHLGHAFTYASFDVLIRYLEYLGYRVNYVQNVTDIDDDVLRKAREVDDDWWSLGNRWTRHFISDMCELNIRPPDVYPRATDVIPDMFPLIQRLLDKELAYVAEGNVYYAVAMDGGFGQVSGLSPEDWLPTANERGNYPEDPHKRDPLDFVLWQAQKPGEPAWESPWGKGRPGWHIECSTMSMKYLGETIDIHGGGGDLAFPHHECEMAQSCGISGNDVFAQFWMHTAMVRYCGEKMSKSLGNLVWIRDLLREHTPDAVRLLMSTHPYHETWEYDASELGPADDLARHLMQAATLLTGSGEPLPVDDSVRAFEAALDDNLDTRRALDVLSSLADRIHEAALERRSVRAAQDTLRELGAVFGLRFDGEVESRVRRGWGAHMARFR